MNYSPRILSFSPDGGDHHVILEEDLFLKRLSIERKRTERSGKPFVLLLLNAEDVFGGPTGDQSIREVEHAVSSAVGDIDLVGWYSTARCLGVIVPELGDEIHPDVLETILHRVEAGLHAYLPAADADQITISLHVFPEPVPADIQASHSMRFYPDVPVRQRARRVELILKRIIDIVGSSVALLLLSPVLLILALLVKLTSRGPALFKQVRVGQYGEKFTFLKFRSMYVNNDPKIHQEYVASLIAGNKSCDSGNGSRPVFKIQNDPRITRIGHFLRKSSLDELPQFINVLRGEMSLVGPRPPVPYEFEKYDVWHRRRSFEIKPGITGLWQVNGRSRTTFDEMVRLDLQYARDWTIWGDIKILLKTPKAVISGDGAY
jgi:lipopolysaccharide/colanic/teichoic acid biosynthesis glycosyltransferase